MPADRLLVFEVKEGWTPLCKFLGLPVPDTPFPNVNNTAEQLRKLRNSKAGHISINVIDTQFNPSLYVRLT